MNRIETHLLARVPFVLPMPAAAPQTRPLADSGPALTEPSADAVEFSDHASALSQRAAPPRFSKISRLRDQIESGSFETKTRIEGTVARLADLLGL
ncbi:MAG: hypothetical protein IT449_11685 [Phycisphaerales bacterium]|nr:hypothetical protein [Phycisphaerales bacterium]